jgi:hypothetical protein
MRRTNTRTATGTKASKRSKLPKLLDQLPAESLNSVRGLLIALPVCGVFWLGVAYVLLSGR